MELVKSNNKTVFGWVNDLAYSFTLTWILLSLDESLLDGAGLDNADKRRFVESLKSIILCLDPSLDYLMARSDETKVFLMLWKSIWFNRFIYYPKLLSNHCDLYTNINESSNRGW